MFFSLPHWQTHDQIICLYLSLPSASITVSRPNFCPGEIVMRPVLIFLHHNRKSGLRELCCLTTAFQQSSTRRALCRFRCDAPNIHNLYNTRSAASCNSKRQWLLFFLIKRLRRNERPPVRNTWPSCRTIKTLILSVIYIRA